MKLDLNTDQVCALEVLHSYKTLEDFWQSAIRVGTLDAWERTLNLIGGAAQLYPVQENIDLYPAWDELSFLFGVAIERWQMELMKVDPRIVPLVRSKS